MNSDKAPNFDIKMTFGKDLRCQRSAGFALLDEAAIAEKNSFTPKFIV
ncbi:hypothetical protein BHECKSOX_2112 [Bathymodiolus heckerae thiotrophic gill symbiont]|nr:hypothetical protein [Bathymodiolus heckerae thiotrophic gill symbiont]SHN93090.1 hypothetical protein BHECKSOX_2112 [Bathymodiolus heckerae thiotrophic gill symbiont]